jgi:hypothetical protein
MLNLSLSAHDPTTDLGARCGLTANLLCVRKSTRSKFRPSAALPLLPEAVLRPTIARPGLVLSGSRFSSRTSGTMSGGRCVKVAIAIAAIAAREVVMPNIVRTNIGRTILIGATLALSMGTSTAAFAQPGASFQTRSQREADGLRGVPSVLSRTKHEPEVYREWDGFAPGYAWYPYDGSNHWVRYDRIAPRPGRQTPERWNYADSAAPTPPGTPPSPRRGYRPRPVLR